MRYNTMKCHAIHCNELEFSVKPYNKNQITYHTIQKRPNISPKCVITMSPTQAEQPVTVVTKYGTRCPPRAYRATKRGTLGPNEPFVACFWPNCHWLVQRDDPHPYHVLGPLNGPLWHSWGPQKGPFWPRKAFLGAPEVLRGPRGTYFWPNCHWLIRVAEPYPYHVLQPLQRPLRHSCPQRGNI